MAQNSETIAETGAFMTAEDLARLPDDEGKYELVEGRLVKMPPTGGGHDSIASRLHIALGAFVEAHNLGECTLSQAGYRLSLPGKPDTVLAPDLAFVRADRLPQPGTAAWDEFWQLARDLVVEVVSPSESRPKMEALAREPQARMREPGSRKHQPPKARARQWLDAGARLVWLIWPKAKQVEVWQPGSNKPTQTLSVSDLLDGLDVVPGFSYPIARLFR
ncbi:MAG TPA: Uma2 family endonuclease [Ktedonobacterales bacterium]|nr:Uma2 family endonuclease [Ktedonobacterales bacterium]